jgi:hypothetical protein
MSLQTKCEVQNEAPASQLGAFLHEFRLEFFGFVKYDVRALGGFMWKNCRAALKTLGSFYCWDSRICQNGTFGLLSFK